MDSVEFSKKYIDDGLELGKYSQLNRLTTAITLGMLGSENPEADSIIQSHTNGSSAKVLMYAKETEGSENRYLKGDYIPEHQGGIGNPSYMLLTYAMRSIWSSAYFNLRRDEPINPIDIKAIDLAYADLRGMGANLLWKRDRVIRSSYGSSVEKYAYDTDKEGSRVRDHIEGMLNEFDIALVLGAVAMRNELYVVPAPPAFERGHGLKSDFLMIDPKNKQVAGVQAKLREVEEDRERYSDPEEGVVLITGMSDLENYRTRYCPGQDRRTVEYSYAGLVVKMCNQVFDWRSPQQYLARTQPGNKDFHRYILRQGTNRQSTKQKVQLFHSYSRKADHLWSKIEPVLRSTPK